jgi:hypothetical protein
MERTVAIRAATEAPLEEFTKGELLKMATEGWTGRVTAGILAAISASYQTDQVIRPVNTRNETERRFRICVEGFAAMRRDLHWAIPRILDELPVYLRCRLDRMDWRPDEDRSAWIGENPEPGELTEDGSDIGNPATEIQGTEIGDD